MSGQTAVPPLPSGLQYVQVETGWGHAAAIRSDGLAAEWGDNGYNPSLGTDLAQITGGAKRALGLHNDGSPVSSVDSLAG